MKFLRPALFGALTLIILCAACAPDVVLSNPPSAVPPTPTLAAVVPNTGLFGSQPSMVLGKPQMQIGSAYRYFDGALLDAVPNNGPFLMGAQGGLDNPEHKVTVSDFWIYSTDVSNAMYAWCVSLGKCSPPNAQDDPNFSNGKFVNYPVVGVTWQQASDYCGFAHGRLPTEAEWEKAASWDGTNSQQLLYPWGSANPTCNVLNARNCINHTTSVVDFGQGRSFYGAYNMEGDVFQWIGDWYGANYYSTSPATDPMGPSTGTQRVIRGSAFDSDAALATPARRFQDQPTSHRANLGFRCVVQDPAYYAPFCTMPVTYGVSALTTATPNAQCPNPVVQHLEGCTVDNKPLDFITILSSPPTTVTVTGLQNCTPANNDPSVKHVCPPGVTIQVSANCSVKPASSPACPSNYQQDPNNPLKCTSPGGPGACPAGYQYDNTLQCCSIPAGGKVPGPLCAVGQHPFNNGCVDDLTGPAALQSVTYVTSGISCVAPPPAPGNGTATLVPVPTGTALTPVPTTAPSDTPPPQSTPGPTQPPNTPVPTTEGGAVCTLKPKDCLFGVNKTTCTCNLIP